MPQNSSYDLMHGSQFAKQYVTDYLKADIPTRLIEYRNGWLLDSGDLPEPAKYLNHEPIALDKWPTIITVVISTGSMEPIGHRRSDPIYRMGYTMRSYVWVRTAGSDQTTTMRDRLVTVGRSALLDRPCLAATDPLDAWNATIDTPTMREEFSDLTLLKGDRVMAGGYLGYDLHIDEVVARKDIGTLDEIQFGIDTTDITDTSLDLPADADMFTLLP